MKNFTILVLAMCPTLVMSEPLLDKDGVPQVDVRGTIVMSSDAKAIKAAKEWGTHLPSTRMISVGDKQVSLKDFLANYCKGKAQNKTCDRAMKIQRIDSSSGPRESLPAGI